MAKTEFEKRLDAMSDKEFFHISEPFNDAANDTPYTETIQGQTPNGGAYSRAFFYDKDNRPCVKSEAQFVNIVEYDKQGNRINESYGIMSS